ncbi:Calcineurin subunit B type 2 [Physocladia obscura]|uniref:Calcineurin subunit B n=1 Tax=Physocladia obscura TaxID=109957 RepID=A0AAD5XE68_9FUNG|nr:Calcineurin subunit B type 2 [Physocladia obscura]
MGVATSINGSALLTNDEIHDLQQQTGLPPASIQRLYARFRQLDRSKAGSITPSEMNSIPEFAMNPLAIRIIAVFFKNSSNGADDENVVSFTQFLQCMAVFSRSASRDEKLAFAFQVYDVDGDASISFSDLQTVLKLMVGKSLPDAEIDNLVRTTILAADVVDKDGAISFDEFKMSLFSADLEQSFTLDF